MDWEASVNYQWQQGYEISISGLGAFSATDFDNPNGRIYDDGFVGVDDFGNAQGLTSYWGYDSASQTPADTRSVIFSSASSVANTNFGNDIEPVHGFEIGVRGVFLKTDRMRLGVSLGLGYAGSSGDTYFRMSGLDATIVRDTYTYGPSRDDFIVAAPPGFAGDRSGLGPLLGTDFTRSTEALSGVRSVSGHYDLDFRNLTASLGVFTDWSLTELIDLRLEVGASLADLRADVALGQSVGIEGLSYQTSHFRARASDTLWGYYARAAVLFHLVESNTLSLGFRFADYGEVNAANAGLGIAVRAESLLFAEAGWTMRF